MIIFLFVMELFIFFCLIFIGLYIRFFLGCDENKVVDFVFIDGVLFDKLVFGLLGDKGGRIRLL